MNGTTKLCIRRRLPLPGRVLIVPHVGGNTVESFEKTEVFLAGRVVETLAALEPQKSHSK